MLRLIVLLLPFLFYACTQKPADRKISESVEKLHLQYAEGFTITYDAGIKILEVNQPFPGASESLKYILVPADKEIPTKYQNTVVIRTPISSIACTSTTHIPMLDYLDVSQSLKGFPTLDFISSPKTRQFIDAGKVVDIGMDNSLNIEQLALINPDILLGYTMTGDFGQFKKIQEMKIPVVINAEYLEKHPLGRAEWIKFVAAFFDREKMADSVFAAIEKSYQETAAIAKNATKKPKVLNGIMYGDAWFLPGGENYAAKIIKDAGCAYPWGDDDNNGFLQLSFETVFEKAHDADLWLGVGAISSLAELAASDHKYKLFDAFKRKNVFNYDKRKGAKGGNEYLELGYLRPDLILKDIVSIAHPDALPDHELYFYRRLE
jgi:iron complex transport system substrate-binding protein